MFGTKLVSMSNRYTDRHTQVPHCDRKTMTSNARELPERRMARRQNLQEILKYGRHVFGMKERRKHIRIKTLGPWGDRTLS